ncbi:MAG: hypothetical protein KC589_02590 [Nanoarchaeota archaeon]|nr:hypothetical protein [Nanoarchaeota archaeon]MCA9495804.1 hypothetical protein [Nanoarchaeota archaeon]
MINKINKKGAIEMSLNLIIMLIIGLVVMGLVIGFVTNLVGQAEQNFGDLSDSDKLELDNVMSEQGIFAAGPKTFSIESGGKKNVFIKIYNPTSTAITVAAVSGEILGSAIGSAGSGLSMSATSVDLDATCVIKVQSAPVTIQGKDTQSVIATVTADTSCNSGETFFLTVQFSPTAEITKTETLTGTIIQ